MKHIKKVYVSLTEEQCRALQVLAEKTCRTRAGYIRRIIQTHLCEVQADPGRALK